MSLLADIPMIGREFAPHGLGINTNHVADPAHSHDAKQAILQMLDEDHRPIAEIARTFKVSRSTIYRV